MDNTMKKITKSSFLKHAVEFGLRFHGAIPVKTAEQAVRFIDDYVAAGYNRTVSPVCACEVRGMTLHRLKTFAHGGTPIRWSMLDLRGHEVSVYHYEPWFMVVLEHTVVVYSAA